MGSYTLLGTEVHDLIASADIKDVRSIYRSL